jgi:hypothetical protein
MPVTVINSLRRPRSFTLACLIVLLLSGVGVWTAAPASAATVTQNVNLRPCVDLNNPNCSPVGTTAGGVYKLRCWRDGSWATGNYSSNRWFLLALADGREGYVHSSFVGSQYSTPNCSDLPYVRAADWAIARIGQRTQPSGVGWSGYCATFTYRAFTQGAGVAYESGNAIDQYWKYRNRGLIYGGIPRYGDPVFYNIAQPYGHTAIYIGGTTVVTTQGLEGANLPIARRDLNSFGNYLGWAAV